MNSNNSEDAQNILNALQNAVNNVSIVYSLDNYYKVEEINQNQFTLESLENKDIVVLNGAKEIQSGLGQNLKDYVNYVRFICHFSK